MSYPPYSGPPYPGQPYQAYPGQVGPPPENNLVWAVLCTVLCCLPLGIVSIIRATQVNTLWAQGLYAEAYKSAEDAKKFAIWGMVSQLVVVVGYIAFMIAFMAFTFPITAF